MRANISALPQPLAQTQATERHFTVKELSEKWSLGESTIRKIFMDEPGVLKHGRDGIRAKRKQYVTLRIPESVMLRVYFEHVNRTGVSSSPDQAASGTRRRRERNAVLSS